MGDEIQPPADQLAAVSLSSDAASSSTVKKERFSDRVLVKSILGRPDGGAGLSGQKVRISGRVKTGREQGKGTFAFLEVNDGSCLVNLQVMVDASVYDLSKLVPTGTSVVVDGYLKIPPEGKRTKQKIELSVEKVVFVGTVDKDYPIHKTDLSLKYLRDYTHLRSRTNLFAAVESIRDELEKATHGFFGEEDFLKIRTPIITTSDCEGAGEMFQVTTLMSKPVLPVKDGRIDYSQDFFGRKAFLTVSGQLQLEISACSHRSAYTFGPTFRAENSHTSRHLAEFSMVEAELTEADLEDDMNCAEAYVKYMCEWLLEKCDDAMEFMAKNADEGCIERLKSVAMTPFERVTYTEAIELLEKAVSQGKVFENHVEWGIDLASEHERYLTEVVFQKPVVVYNYPKGIKAFYMRVNDDGKTVAAMDVLVPKVGELIGGSQREERYEVIKERMEEMGLPTEPYEWYLDLRRLGTVKHSGFGLGFERMVLFVTGMDNIRDVTPFPRYPGRADL
ncbi:unnamed protein product [Microthlaspi erraticum]|uniref:asparagine--tRNA ligase n=1 Tax=Microthlaspi erraticum TaxID=1685480 RepID=A0A6D2LC34_9BRAS|nr:unnamed protein product [Microthlaspi erraticum]